MSIGAVLSEGFRLVSFRIASHPHTESIKGDLKIFPRTKKLFFSRFCGFLMEIFVLSVLSIAELLDFLSFLSQLGPNVKKLTQKMRLSLLHPHFSQLLFAPLLTFKHSSASKTFHFNCLLLLPMLYGKST